MDRWVLAGTGHGQGCTWLLEELGRLSAWSVQSSLGAGFGEGSWLQATVCFQRKNTLDFFM